MIAIPELTPELLARLSQEMGGRDFTDENQKQFLSSNGSCDVQAVPGNGKTTLLAAKIALLSPNWTSRTEGICIISHTNAARDEVEKALLKHPTASAFLNYPHFIGTVTGFLHQYLALPYLRGLGWSVDRIDDEAFAAAALSRLGSKQNLVARTRMQRGMFKKQVEDWVKKLELKTDFQCEPDEAPIRLAVRHLPRQHGPATDCGRDLEELKAELVNRGLFRFGDMTVLASRAIDACPAILDRLRQRFPMVLLDEAQDTSGAQLRLLDRIFGGGGVAYQRLGDQNQTLYESTGVVPEDQWRTGENVVPLHKSRRFGTEIASFASRLTSRSPQQIEGLPGLPSRRVLLLFDEASVRNVMTAYAEEVRVHWNDDLNAQRAIWAVASRHSAYRRQGAWRPKSLVDYHPGYRAETSSSAPADSFCRLMQQASMLYAGGKPMAGVLEMLSMGLVRYLTLSGLTAPSGQRVSASSLWRSIAAIDGRRVLGVRRLFRDSVLFGTAAWEAIAWENFCSALRDCLALPNQPADRAARLTEYVAYVDTGGIAIPAADLGQSIKSVTVDGIVIRLGSIHSLKGRTVDSILVVESEIYRGPAAGEQVMDLEAVLPHAFGIEERDFSANAAQLSAATNVFVGVTRPREILALALRKTAAPEAMLAAARQQGWQVRDLTA